ncbi:MAG: PadR family transcriptional regulator [Oscillospiraceae bacterium]
MKIDKSLLSGSTTLLVLKLLSEGEKYGYEMIQELAARSDHTFELKEGTLYPILHDLENKGCLTSRVRETPGGRQRKYYAISDKGLGLLRDKTAEWQTFSQKVNDVVFGPDPKPVPAGA